jgi:hypothetical protein
MNIQLITTSIAILYIQQDIRTAIKIMMTLLIYIGIYFPKLKPYLLNYLFFYIDALVLCFLNCPNYQIFVYEYRIPMDSNWYQLENNI